jgi:SAM-dependent methyltransferase
VKEYDAMAAQAAIAAQVAAFYEDHPYPPPIDDLAAYGRAWDERRRRTESYLFWPGQSYRDDRSILVAGCGTVQAAHYAVRWPSARVVGIDVSDAAIAHEHELKRKHRLDNLELRELSIEDVAGLNERFNFVACTGVLHHLADPGAALAALRGVLSPDGAMHLMVYAPYGRAGIYMLAEYCRRLRIGANAAEIRDLVASLRALPNEHPIVPLMKSSPDFASEAGIADALLHPNDRAYAVSEFLQLLVGAGLTFGRWLRQAPYLPWCGTVAGTPHAAKLHALPETEQYAALELFRGTMLRHSAIAYHKGRAAHEIDFESDAWLEYVPIRLADTVIVRDRLPPGASAVLINRSHRFTDLYLPIDAVQERLLEAIDGKRRIADMGRAAIDKEAARHFFQRLWRWDQVVFDTSRARDAAAL